MGAILIPDVNHRLLPGKSHTLLAPQVISVHTMVWDIANCERYFRQAGNPYSHVGTGHDGEVRQWQDLRYRAASDYQGNPYNISIENADSGPGFPKWSGSDVPDFTDAQAESLIVVLSWLCHRFGLPKAAIGSSCPHERGIGWHRHGVDPYRNKSCGRRWSSAYAKACPGNRRIEQLTREIIPAVSAPTIPQEDDMPLSNEDIRKVSKAVWDQVLRNNLGLNAPAHLVVGDIFVHARRGAKAQGADIDEAEIARMVLEGLDPAAIAAAIPDSIADKVADVLAERLAAESKARGQ